MTLSTDLDFHPNVQLIGPFIGVRVRSESLVICQRNNMLCFYWKQPKFTVFKLLLKLSIEFI